MPVGAALVQAGAAEDRAAVGVADLVPVRRLLDVKAAVADAEVEPAVGPDEIEVSVVMPCLNEADGVGICVEKALRAIAAMGVTGEVVVVMADGSEYACTFAEHAEANR